jgi:hypothetical protein
MPVRKSQEKTAASFDTFRSPRINGHNEALVQGVEQRPTWVESGIDFERQDGRIAEQLRGGKRAAKDKFDMREAIIRMSPRQPRSCNHTSPAWSVNRSGALSVRNNNMSSSIAHAREATARRGWRSARIVAATARMSMAFTSAVGCLERESRGVPPVACIVERET